MSFDVTQDTQSYGQVDLEKLVIQSASGLDEEDQKATVTELATVFNELLPIIPLWERYGNNPALDGERVTGWLPEGDPIYQNSPYEDSFTVIMLMDGTLKPAGQ
jgi:peptide/nickel transport system substrate-binding protein